MAIEGGTRVRLMLLAPRGIDLGTLTPRVADACRQVTDDVSGRVLDDADLGTRGGKASAWSETFRVLAANVEHMAATAEVRSILVMSAYRGDGRTLTVQNLGRALAENGHRVVIVDTNGGARSDKREGGLGIKRQEPVVARSTADVHAIPNGHAWSAADQPRTNLNVARGEATSIKGMLAALRPLAEFILVDSPACQVSADAFLLAPLVDGVIYVVRRRRQDVAMQRQVQSQLSRLGARLLGAVFNEA